MPVDHPDLGKLQLLICGVLHRLERHAEADEAYTSYVFVTRRSQIRCSGPGCKRRLREDGAALDVCVNCRLTFYCGKACQTADWKAGHKKECKALVAEAAAAAAAEGGTS